MPRSPFGCKRAVRRAGSRDLLVSRRGQDLSDDSRDDDEKALDPDLLPEVWEPGELDEDEETEPEPGDFCLEEDESET